jgi:hypothetical protein
MNETYLTAEQCRADDAALRQYRTEKAREIARNIDQRARNTK